jgi:uncharacterized protein YajQ (UPF0234 family)
MAAKDNSFDVVSDIDMQEMDNSINQVNKEITQRYDFKGSAAKLELNGNELKLTAEDEYKIEAILDMLRLRMAKRGLPLRCLLPGKVEPAARGSVRQNVTIQKGISKEKAKDIVNTIKNLKLKVQASIQNDQVRISGAKKDDLQAAIAALKQADFGIDLQFVNMR